MSQIGRVVRIPSYPKVYCAVHWTDLRRDIARSPSYAMIAKINGSEFILTYIWTTREHFAAKIKKYSVLCP